MDRLAAELSLSDWLQKARDRAKEALARGVLEPMETLPEHHEDGGVSFVVRRLQAFTRKPRGHVGQPDPFLPPYEPELFVGELPPAHAILLNRFPVLDDHLLVVTLQWEDQELPPTPEDLEALDRVLAEVDGVCFYNGGVLAGASQPHRHLQLVSREAFGPVPVEGAVRAALAEGEARVAGWPFVHAISGRDEGSTRAFQALYTELGAPLAFSLVYTRDWMLLAPRTSGQVQGIPVNSLGYAGSMMVKDELQLEHLQRVGAMQILAEAGVKSA
jgi:ATP adenylyltransferase